MACSTSFQQVSGRRRRICIGRSGGPPCFRRHRLEANTELLTYSRSRGAFAGITLDGAVVEQDADSTRAIYGRDPSFRAILSGNIRAPKSTLSFKRAIAGRRLTPVRLPERTRTTSRHTRQLGAIACLLRYSTDPGQLQKTERNLTSAIEAAVGFCCSL